MTSETLTTGNLLSHVKERGYWKVVIHPTVFQSNRIPTLDECWQIIQTSQVNLRGYLAYPRLPDEPAKGSDWIEGGGEFGDALEVWRFYQSGQFIHHFFVSEDWLLDPWGTMNAKEKSRLYASGDRELNIYNALYTCTETLQFASRLAYRDVLEPAAFLRIELHGMNGRRLVAPQNESALHGMVSRQDITCWEVSTLPLHLIAAAPELAVDAVLALLKPFGWNPSRAALERQQRRLLERRP
jgi:hypothetical protein